MFDKQSPDNQPDQKTVAKNTAKLIAKIYEIEETQGTNAKKDVLRKYENDGAFTETLRWYFDNLIVTGLKEKKIENLLTKKIWSLDSDLVKEIATWGFIDLLNYIQENNTGRDVDAAVVLEFAQPFDKKTQTGIIRIATKSWDKGLGIGRTTCNSVYGDDFLTIHEVMLCADYFGDPDYYVGKTFGTQVKLDGFRMTAFKKGNTVRVFSRSGKEQTGNFPLIEKDIIDAFPNIDVVLDGERQPLGFMEMDSKMQYKLVSNSTKKGGSKEVCFAVYDYMSLKEWETRKPKMTYSERYGAYQSILTTKPGVQKYKYLFALPCMYIGDDISEIEAGLNWAKENDKEGIIVKDMDGFYEWDRTIACAKVKSFFDIDLPIIGMQEGRGRNKGRLGALIVNYKGNEVGVGTGLSDAQRTEFWKNKNKYIGRTAEIVYFEVSKNKQGVESLRFPVFKCIKDGN